MNLFKKIWLKNLQKNKEPIEKFVEDIGSIKGRFIWTKIDPKTHQKLESNTIDNAVTINGRTSIIRLLAQSANSNKTNDAANPTRYRIARMRFGNAVDSPPLVTSSDLNLHYYDVSEISYRLNTTPVTGNRRGAGGRTSNIPTGAPAIGVNSSHTFREVGYNATTNPFSTTGNIIIRNLTGSGAQEFNNLRAATDLRPAREPSHGSVYVILRNDANQIIEIYHFGGIYNKSIAGNTITRMWQPPQNSVTTWSDSNLVNVTNPNQSGILNLNNTSLFYDSVDKRWKIRFVTKNDFTGNGGIHNNVRNLRIELKIGAFNIVDSIVPTLGANTGGGTTNIARFGGQPDSYTITNTSFADGPTPIDDYQVSFSVIMAANQGNGENPTNNSEVYYNEAFLFNERDDLFSIIRIPGNGGFVKNVNTAYLLTWQLTVDPV